MPEGLASYSCEETFWELGRIVHGIGGRILVLGLGVNFLAVMSFIRRESENRILTLETHGFEPFFSGDGDTREIFCFGASSEKTPLVISVPASRANLFLKLSILLIPFSEPLS